MKYLSLTKEGDVFVVTMINGTNTFTNEVLEEHIAVCDEIEKSTNNGAVILASNDPKYWCNGINLDWLIPRGGEAMMEFKDLIDKTLMRWATLPFPTIAAMNGHAYAGGAILSCCFDFRFMRKDKGFFCFPEIDVNIPFTEKMFEVIESIPNKQALWNLGFTGRRIGGEEAKNLQVVNECYSGEELMAKTMELAQFLAQKDRATYNAIKMGFKRNLLKFKGT